MVMVNPSINTNGEVYATTVTNDLTDSASISFSISNGTIGELDNDSIVSTEVVPGLVSYIDNSIKITTKQIDRFYVGVQAAPDGTSELIGTTNKVTISGVGKDVSPREFDDNTWGYALTNTNANSDTLTYDSLPAYSAANTPQYTSNKNLTDGEYNLKLVFAAKINANRPADHYTTKTIVSILADAKALTTLFDITYMQEMTSDICKDTPAPVSDNISTMTKEQVLAATPSKQLIDKRDNKYYWVSKLADGNCWMTQNLDFDVPYRLNIDGVVTSDIATANVNTDTIVLSAPEDWTVASDNQYYNAYLDPGDYIYNGPEGEHGYDINNTCNKKMNADPLSDCKNYAKTVANTDALGDVNAHYHVGNYYSYSAATVKTGDSLTKRGDNAPSSICPQNWQLPASGTTQSNVLLTNGKTFAKLFEAYGWSWNLGYQTTESNGGTSYSMHDGPFDFVYGGKIESDSNVHRGLTIAGFSGAYWSSTWQSEGVGFALVSSTALTSPSNNNTASQGLSVRCVAR